MSWVLEEGARWISGDSYEYGKDDAGYYEPHGNHVLRREFSLGSSAANLAKRAGAILRIAVLGFCRVYVNSVRASDAELLGDWTNYSKLAYYRDLEVGSLLREGDNVVAVEMGNGWYNPAPLRLFGKYNLRERLAEVGTPKIALELRIGGVGGETALVSDESWDCCEGQLLFNNVYLGEWRDLSRVNPATEVDGTFALRPVTATAETRRLEPAPHPACIRSEWFEPADVREVRVEDGSTALLVDAGEMVTGIMHLCGSSHEGGSWDALYAEELGPDGLPRLDANLAGMVGLRVPHTAPEENRFITGGPGAPSVAAERDVVLCAEGETCFEGEFSVHSFRYVLIRGLSLVDLREIAFAYVHTDLTPAGELSCGNELLDSMASAAIRTKLNNVHGIWEDCARERLGYGGDMVALSDSNLLAFDCSGLLRRTVRDFRVDQTPAGGVPETAPYMGIQSNGTAPGEGPLLWQLAYPYLIKKAVQYYGDLELLRTEWPFVKCQVDYLLSWDPQELATHCLGDHGSVVTGESWKAGTPDKNLVGWCAILWFAKTAAELAGHLDDRASRERYESAAENLTGEIRARFLGEDGALGDDTQTAWAFGGSLGLVDARVATSVLADKVREADGVLETGIFGTKMAFELLHAFGRDEVIETWLLRSDWPSYRDMLSSGSGALSEQFVHGAAGLGSCNHAMFTSYLQWLYQALAGISVADDSVGADHLVVSPYFAACSTGASASYATPRGRACVSWERAGLNLVSLVASWPAACRTDLVVPRGWKMVRREDAPCSVRLTLTCENKTK